MKKFAITCLLLASPAFCQTVVTTGGTQVFGDAQGVSGSISGGSCPSGQVVSALSAAGVPTCVAAPAATVNATSLKGLSPALGAVTTTQVNGTSVIDQLQTTAGNDGFAAAVASGGTCYGKSCAIESSMTYIVEYSNYFLPAIGGATDFYARYPFQGGYGFPKVSTYKGGANWQMRSINSLPAGGRSIYTPRTPFVFEHAVSNNLGYATNTGVVAVRLRSDGSTHNYGNNMGSIPTQKGNFSAIAVDAIVRDAGQIGGVYNASTIHTALGDLMEKAVQAQYMGAGENEDEHLKSCRCFYSTATRRFGGTLNAAPTANPFGYFAMNVTQTSGYSNDIMAASDMPLVNLSRTYTGGDATAFQSSSFAGFAQIPVSDISAVVSTFGTSSFTTLTSDMTSQTYSGCPATITNSAPQVPDPAILNENGVGGLVAYCLTLGSTSGLADGKAFSIGGEHGNFEDAKVAHVVDSTHITANLSLYHAAGEHVGFNGTQGYAFNLPGDDIAPGTFTFDSTGSNQTTLHKYFYVLGNDSSYLYAWINSAAALEFTSTQYVGTSPTTGGSLGTAVLSGTALASIPVTVAGNYGISVSNNLSTGQSRLSAPAITIDPSGSACSAKPAAHAVMGTVSNVYQITGVVVDAPGTCSSAPATSLQSVWHNPYKLAPATVTSKVVDPLSGSATSGYLLTQVIDPTKWQSGDAVEIVAGLHDFVGGNELFAKYLTGGNSTQFGPSAYRIFKGDYGYPSALEGLTNAVDGRRYYEDATHPVGPGVAYERPPDAKAYYGAYSNVFPLSEPPLKALFSVPCFASNTIPSNNPCLYGKPQAYDLFNPQQNIGGRYYEHHLRFDPTLPGEPLSYDGPIIADTITTRQGVTSGSTVTGTTGGYGTGFKCEQIGFGSTSQGCKSTWFINAGGNDLEVGYIQGYLSDFAGDYRMSVNVKKPDASYNTVEPLTVTPGGIQVPSIAVIPSSPSAGSVACVANTMWHDDNYFYACNAAGSASKRVALNAF